MAIDAWAYGVLAAFIFMVVCPLAPRMVSDGVRFGNTKEVIWRMAISYIDYMYTVYIYI